MSETKAAHLKLKLVPVFGNRFHVTMTPDTTRIAIGEDFTGTNDLENVNFHTAFAMPAAEAIKLAQLILLAHQQSTKAKGA